MSLEESSPIKWFLRTSPESLHGELTLDTLRQWAEQGRIMADNELSRDGDSWTVASELPELKMEWLVTLKSGARHGPLNLLSIPSLYRRGVIDNEAILENKNNQQKIPAASLLRGLNPQPDPEPDAEPEPASEVPAQSGVTLKRNDEVDGETAPAESASEAPPGPPPVRVSPFLKPTGSAAADAPSAATNPGPDSPAPTAPMDPKPVVPKPAAPAPAGGLLETIQALDAKAKDAELLRGRVQQLTQENEALKRAPQDPTPGKDGQDEAVRALSAEVKALQKQAHVASVRIETAEKANAEQLDELARVSTEAEELRQTFKGFETVAAAVPPSAPVSLDGLDAVHDALNALQREQASAAAALGASVQTSAGTTDSLEQTLHTLIEDANAMNALVATVAGLQSDLQKTQAANSKDLEGRIQMTKSKREDVKNDQQAEASLRQRIALLEAALADYKNKETKAAPPKKAAAPAAKRELADSKAKLKKAEAEERVESVRSELDAVITELREEKEALEIKLKTAKKPAAPKKVAKPSAADTKKLNALKAKHKDTLAELTASHESAVSDLKTELDAAKAAAKAAAEAPAPAPEAPAGGADVVALKQQNLSLSERDAEQSKSIADLKTQVAGLYSEMAARQKEALARFKERESQLKEDMSALTNGAVADAPRPEAAKSREELKALRDEVAQLRKDRDAAQQGAAQKVADVAKEQEAAQAEITTLKQAAAERDAARKNEAALKAKLAEAETAHNQQKVSDEDAKKQSAQVDVDRKAWQSREAELGKELDALKASLANKDAAAEKAAADSKTQLDKAREAALASLKQDDASEREKALEADLKVLRAEYDALRKSSSPATGGRPAAAGQKPDVLSTWFLRLDSGKIFGPVSLTELIEWAADCRIGPDHQVSPDSKNWQKAAEVEGLRMHWQVRLADGQEFGPLNLFAVGQFIQDGVLNSDASVTHAETGEKHSFNTMIAQEIRVLLEREKKLVEALENKTPEPPKGARRRVKKIA